MTGIRQTVPAAPAAGRRDRAYTAKHLDALTARAGLGAADRLAVRAVGAVLPFRTNAYVVEELIDWAAAPDDPIYRLVFPQADMLPAADVQHVSALLATGAAEPEIRAAAHEVRMRLNPHPAGQLDQTGNVLGIKFKISDDCTNFLNDINPGFDRARDTRIRNASYQDFKDNNEGDYRESTNHPPTEGVFCECVKELHTFSLIMRPFASNDTPGLLIITRVSRRSTASLKLRWASVRGASLGLCGNVSRTPAAMACLVIFIQ